jgi:hypothetical protein
MAFIIDAFADICHATCCLPLRLFRFCRCYYELLILLLLFAAAAAAMPLSPLRLPAFADAIAAPYATASRRFFFAALPLSMPACRRPLLPPFRLPPWRYARRHAMP